MLFGLGRRRAAQTAQNTTMQQPAARPAAAPRMYHQWYMNNPRRYEDERMLVLRKCAKLNPREVQLPDGRRGMKLTFKVPDPEGSIRNANGTHSKAYEMMLVWNADHPASADRLYGGSIRAYFSDPTYKEVMADFTCHGRPYVPHMLKDKHPVTGGELLYPCTAQTNKCQPETFCMTQAIGLAYNWLSQYTAAKYSSEAFAIMSRH